MHCVPRSHVHSHLIALLLLYIFSAVCKYEYEALSDGLCGVLKAFEIYEGNKVEYEMESETFSIYINFLNKSCFVLNFNNIALSKVILSTFTRNSNITTNAAEKI